MKKIALLLALCLTLSLVAGCSGDKPELNGPVNTKNYTFDCGASIDAPSNMKETEVSGYSAALDSRKVAMLLLEEQKPDGYNLADYAYLICSTNSIENPFAQDTYGNMATSYVAPSNGDDWFYYVTIVESPTSFWLCQFACKNEDRATYEDQFAKWSATLAVPGGRVTVQTGTVDFTSYPLECGVTLLGEKDLEAYDVEGITAFYTNNKTGFALILEEKYDGMTLEDYADAVCQVNGYDAMELNAYGDYCTEHTYTDSMGTYWYYTTVHEISDGFLMVQYFCFEDAVDTYRPYFELWSSALTETN